MEPATETKLSEEKLLPEMAAPKKRKIASECRRFQTRWENEYFFKEINRKCVCLIYNEDVAVMKEYNVRWHYETKHQSYTSYTGAERTQKVKQMADSLQANKIQENATTASYEVAKLIAQHGKPFSDGDFIKQCLIKVTEIMCPEKVPDFNNVSLSRNTVVHDFSVVEKQIKLFSTPFLVDAEEVEESLQLELIEMQCDDSLKSQHQLLSLPEFYQSLDNAKFPLMRRPAKRMMSLFDSTYICEQTFSLLNQNKSRLRTRMTDSHLCEVLRVSTTKLSPDMSAILQSKGQHHCSH
ncbi:hypothetical protein AMELA_G00267610 [Ameiurus melas]|uniref:SPIN-DOC-like zinc-finger domain-containing protein n=1 Tax=Ameiurus melas TaxID=219545 RepID=A0A7J5ZQ00_AMEME|nr:hypothetical protein AMELA_G00267610 [Ameiurus melas]